MRVRAKTNISRNSGWVFSGTEFNIREEEMKELAGMVEVVEEKTSPATPPANPEISTEGNEPAAEAKPARNSRKRKPETV